MNKNKKGLIIGIVGLLILVVAIAGYFGITKLISESKKDDTFTHNIQISTETEDVGTIHDNTAMTYFMGYDIQRLHEGDPIPLSNELNNADDNIYMQYTITDEAGNELYTSDLIAPGQQYLWVASDYLPVGEHELVFNEQPFKVKDVSKDISESNLEALYYIDQNVTVIIE